MPHMDEPPAVVGETKELWRPSSPETTQMYNFMVRMNKIHGLSLHDYHDLWRWSVSEPAKFWEEMWHYASIKAHEPYKKVSIFSDDRCPTMSRADMISGP